jgi:hypothetical protein
MANLSKEKQAAIVDFFEKYTRDNTPLPGYICHCGGKVTRMVSGFFRGQFLYGLAACRVCGRIYTNAENAPTEGEDEFAKAMSTVITI